MNIKLNAFSLAEVLTVVAIIGIIAALTIPNVNSDAEDRKVVSSLRKVYADISTAYDEIVAEHGKPYEWNSRSYDLYRYLVEKLATTKNCSNSSNSSDVCFLGKTNTNQYTVYHSSSDYYKMILKDGASVAIKFKPNADISPANEDESYACQNELGEIVVDVNGAQGENQEGYDIFKFNICSNGILPKGLSAHHGVTLGDQENFDYTAGWIIKAGNRDYLKCDGLNWDTKRSCK